MYNGLTTADKGALLDAQKSGARWIARDWNNCIYGYYNRPNKTDTRVWIWTGLMHGMNEKSLEFVKWEDPDPVNIDLALAQIAEMESKENNALSEKASEKGCMTWNDRINQMTVEEKARWLYDMDVCRVSSISIEECNSYRHCTDCMKNLLNSPYTEGETK